MNNIEILEELIKYWKDLIKISEESSPIYNWIKDEKIEEKTLALENLIKENKELKERLENRRAIDKELEKENKTLLERHKNTMNLIGANYIHKDKVKEKIKEFNAPIMDVLDKLPLMPRTIERGCGAKDGIIYVLQEILEEGE